MVSELPAAPILDDVSSSRKLSPLPKYYTYAKKLLSRHLTPLGKDTLPPILKSTTKSLCVKKKHGRTILINFESLALHQKIA